MNTKLIFIQKVVAEAIAGRNKGGAMHQERHTRLFTAIAVGLAVAVMAPIGAAKAPPQVKVTIPDWLTRIQYPGTSSEATVYMAVQSSSRAPDLTVKRRAHPDPRPACPHAVSRHELRTHRSHRRHGASRWRVRLGQRPDRRRRWPRHRGRRRWKPDGRTQASHSHPRLEAPLDTRGENRAAPGPLGVSVRIQSTALLGAPRGSACSSTLPVDVCGSPGREKTVHRKALSRGRRRGRPPTPRAPRRGRRPRSSAGRGRGCSSRGRRP